MAKLDCFPWPKGVPAVSFDFNPDRSVQNRWGSEVSMTMYRLLALAVMFCLDGCVDKPFQAHFTKWYRWSTHVRFNEHTQTQVPSLQAQGRQLLEEGAVLMPDVYDRPNGIDATSEWQCE
jgi:hypothetical protein